MALPKSLKDRYAASLDALTKQGLKIATGASRRKEEGRPRRFASKDGHLVAVPTHYYAADSRQFAEWSTRCVNVLNHILPGDHPTRGIMQEFAGSPDRTRTEVECLVGRLRALKKDFAEGLLDDLPNQVRAEVSADYLVQAEVLLAEGYYVASAVLAGAVLEDALRKLCDGKGILVTKPSGERKGINAMNDDLGRASVYNAAKADEIRAWAKYRNDCAHGDGAKVKPEDVGRMIQGVRAFVADHLS